MPYENTQLPSSLLLQESRNVDVSAICRIMCMPFLIKVPWIAIGDDIFYKGEANLITTLGMLGLLVSLCFIALSREKDEDEMTGQIRMQSFVWSLWFTAIILALGILFIMGLDFLTFTCAAIYLYFLVYILKFNLTMKAIRREGK